jgi:uroporphyrinogen-III synthase
MRVLVTRPEPDASRSAERLDRLGHEAVVLPLSQIFSTSVAETVSPSEFDAVAVTSTNAVRYAPPALLAALKRLRCHAVGTSTAKAAQAAGFEDVVQGPGDAAGLAKSILADLPETGRLLYLTGRIRMPEFERQLQAGGLSVTAILVYDTQKISHAADFVLSRLDGKGVDAVLLYSANGAEVYGRMASTPGLAQSLGNARLLCLSGRVEAALPPPLRAFAETASRPDEASLFALLDATG